MRKPSPPPPPPPPPLGLPPPPPPRTQGKSTGEEEAAAAAPAALSDSSSRTITTTTTLPGAIPIPGWRRRRRRFIYRDDDDDDDDDEDYESTESRRGEEEEQTTPNYAITSSTSHHHEICLCAHTVDGNEMQRHAELLYQQMLSQAVVAELVDEEEMRRRAHAQAVLEFQKNNQAVSQQEYGKTSNITNDGKKKRQQQKLLIVAACFFFISAGIFAIVVLVTAQDAVAAVAAANTDDADLPTTRITPPAAVPSFTSIRSTPSVNSAPSTTPSSMPSAASSWQQIGNSIQGMYDLEFFGFELTISGDGNTFVASAQTGQVRAYSYVHHHGNSSKNSSIKNNETDKTEEDDDSSWEPLGPSFPLLDYENDIDAQLNGYDKISLSPNGKYVALIHNNFWFNDIGARIRIFALRDNTNHKNNNSTNTSSNATTTNESDATNDSISDNFIWEQIGHDVVHSSSSFSSASFSPVVDMEWIMSASLTDNLVLAIGCYAGEFGMPGRDQGTVYMYQWNPDNANNNNSTSWIRMGQAIQLHAWSLQLVQAQNNNTSSSTSSSSSSSSSNNGETTTASTMLILAVGELFSARTFRYKPEMDSWIQFGSELVADDSDNEESSGLGVMLSLSMTDGKTMTVGVRNDALGEGIGLLRTYLYDDATDDWIQLDQDLQDSTFLFGQSFALSGNGKVLVATTQELDVIVQSGAGWVTGQIRTWDFITADDQSTSDSTGIGAGGKWIQRGAALEAGRWDSGFGFKIALSEDGNRLVTSAPYALNEQGVHTGKIRVYEQY